MRRLLQAGWWLCAALVLMLGISAAFAADRKITLLPGTDLPGFDYSVVKGVTIAACEAACQNDNMCHAFTFNEKAKWCFLKSDAGTPAPFATAVSGRVEAGQAPEAVAAARLADLPFPAQDLVNSARAFATNLPKSDPPPAGAKYADLVAAGDQGVAKS